MVSRLFSYHAACALKAHEHCTQGIAAGRKILSRIYLPAHSPAR